MRRNLILGLTFLVGIVAASGTAMGAALNLEGVASPVNAAPENSNNALLLMSVTDPNGGAVSGLGMANFRVDATVVAPGGSLVDVERVSEASRNPGFYIVEIVPTTFKETQYTWKKGIYLFSVTVRRGADRGQTVVTMDLCTPCESATLAAAPTPSPETLPFETPSPATPVRKLPDLRVTEINAGTPSIEDNGREANVPLTVTIKNFGGATENMFKISTDVMVEGDGQFVKPFTVPGEASVWYPWQEGLGAGEESTFSGNLYIGHPSGQLLHGKTATIIATVDSCSGDEFMEDYCRVQESDETNNEMETTIKLQEKAKVKLPLVSLRALPMGISS